MAKVLLVDADRQNGSALPDALAEGGHEVVVAPSGSFALTMLERNRPDLLLSWPQVKDMDVCELCSIVRADPQTKEIPFVILTAGDGPTAEAAERAGADLVLPAWSLSIVVARVGTLLSRHPAPSVKSSSEARAVPTARAALPGGDAGMIDRALNGLRDDYRTRHPEGEAGARTEDTPMDEPRGEPDGQGPDRRR